MRAISFFLVTAALSGADILKLNKLPLVFEPNQGQVDSQVRFLARGGGFTLFLTDREAVMSMKGAQPVRMRLVGGAKPKEFERLEPTGGISNYFIGNDPSKWRTEIPQYKRVKVRGVYPGVDLGYYGAGGKLEYDLLVAPGADASRIEIAYQGVESMRVDEQGDLVLKTEGGELRQQRPKVYQEDNGKRIEVEARYRLHGRKQVAFELARYDRAKPLVIDPVFFYSTYLGGSGADQGNGIAVDGNGNAYVTGTTNSPDFPTAGAVQSAYGGGYSDAFVTKINASGSALIYSTYLGGNGYDPGIAIAVDSSGNAYVTGDTGSSNFPTANPIQGTYLGSHMAFVTKINATGSTLIFSTYLGGSGGDVGYGIAVDGQGEVYVTGQTCSTNFPTHLPLQGTYGGACDAFVTKINAGGSALVYSTYLGGSLADYGYGIAVDGSGNAYVTGLTISSDFPTAYPLQGTNHGIGGDAFVTKLSAGGTIMLYSTYLGGSVQTQGQAIAVDGSGNAYVTGLTNSSDFPTVGALQGTYGGDPADAFVTKINASGSALIYSTYLGGSFGDVGYGIAVDGSGNAYVTGYTTSTNFPTASPLQATNGGGYYAFVTKINASGSALVYSTYLGGSGGDLGEAIAVDGSGNAYVTGQTSSTNFPTVNPFQAGNHGSSNAFVSVISGNAQTAVPNVVGLSQAAATTAITSAGLVVGTVSTAASGTVPSGEVISESPVAGTVVSLATAVNLVVSTGPGLVSVPNVVGLTQAAATTAITSAGLMVGTVTIVSSSTVPEGNVISESPVAGTSVFTLSAVNLVVSGTGVIPVLNFNGSAYQDVFLYDPVAGTGYAGLSNGSGAFTYIYNAFTPGFDAIRYGNFTNSGLSGLVAYNSTSTLGYTLLGTGTGTFTPVSLFWGPGFTKTATGDLNGDGLTDVVIYRPTDGTCYTAISNGDGTFHYQYTLVSIGFTHMVVTDFNGDGKADVFFYRSTDGLAYLGIGNGTGGFTFSPVTLGPGYGFVESADINGDGKADLLLYASSSGVAAVGLSTGSGFTFTPYYYSPGFTTVKLFDFNGDGKADVALYNMNNTLGYLGVSNGTGNFTFSSLFWGAGMTNVDALDLNGDGKIDIVIYNTGNGASYTGISSGNPASPFTYQYSYWGNGKVLATTAAQP
jgi:hypothetical protein